MFFSKSLLNALSWLGGCCAISVPVAIHTIGGGDTKKVLLTYCDDSAAKDDRTLNFGEKGVKKVCWSLDSDQQSNQLLENKEEFTELFNRNWNNTTTNNLEWSFDSHSKWKQQCEGVTSPWATFNSESDVERLGLCQQSEYKDVPFVKKQKSKERDVDTWKLWICNKECWETSVQPTVIGRSTMLQQERKENWKTVQFRKKI